MTLREVVEPLDAPTKSTLLIACTSFEERSLAAIRRLGPRYRAATAVVFRCNEYADKGKARENFDEATRILGTSSGAAPLVVNFPIDAPLQSVQRFEAQCRDMAETGKLDAIDFDISTFPRQELFMVLRVLDALRPRPRIRIFYSEPGVYGTEGSPEGWLTRGVRSVSSIPGFGGIQAPSKKKALLIFAGHEDEREAITWKRHQPHKTLCVTADPHYRPEMAAATKALRAIKPSTAQKDWISLPSISARGIDDAYATVLDARQRFAATHYLVVAPLGTKLQSLGIYRAATVQPDVQITYAVPSVYNYAAFSTGCGPLWELDWQPTIRG